MKLSTYRNSEQGRRVPHRPAQALLMVADYDPMVIRRAIRAHYEEREPEGIAVYPQKLEAWYAQHK